MKKRRDQSGNNPMFPESDCEMPFDVTDTVCHGHKTKLT